MGDLPGNDCQKKACVFCLCALVLASVILFGVCMGSYVHLGPDDQVLLKKATGKYVVNGPWSGQLHPFHGQTWRKAMLLDPLQYAIVQDILTSIKRTETGPKLLFLGPYDEVQSTNQKIVLQKHEYVRLTDRSTGEERVWRGPDTVVPEVTETNTGIQVAVFVNVGTAVVTRNKLTGLQDLITTCSNPEGVWFPKALEEVVDIRELIHVLPHEAMVVRDVDGRTTVYSGQEPPSGGQCVSADNVGVGGTAFFLPPYSKIVRMSWSVYTDSNADTGVEPAPAEENPEASPSTSPPPSRRMAAANYHQVGKFERRLSREDVHVFDDKTEERRLESIYVDQLGSSMSTGPKRMVTAIDLRTQKSFYRYEVRTNDNVRLLLEGTIFWNIQDVHKLLNMTSDPEGDVWAKSRSVLIAAISETSLATFMVSFNSIVLNAFDKSKGSTFWTDRGINMESIELNNYKPSDERTADTLQSIIRQTVKRINDLQKQKSENDVLKEKLEADITLEKNMTMLIEQQALNARIVAETAGATEGGRSAMTIGSFMDGLNVTLSNSTERLELYRQHKLLASAQIDTQHLTEGNASIYMSPKDMELRIQLPSHSPEL